MADEKTVEKTTTKFFIFETTDGTTWKFVGTVVAGNREQAERRYYDGSDRQVTFAAVTESAWKPRLRKPKIVKSALFEDFQMPSGPALPPLAEPVEAMVAS